MKKVDTIPHENVTKTKKRTAHNTPWGVSRIMSVSSDGQFLFLCAAVVQFTYVMLWLVCGAPRGPRKASKHPLTPSHLLTHTPHPTPPWLPLSHHCTCHMTPEINLLIYRYLAESGFTHSAFTFAHESLVARSVVSDAEVPPGALISFLQKGLQYVEIETHLQEDGSERVCDEPFTMLAPHVCRLRSAVGKAGSGGAGGAKGGGAALGFSTVEAPPSDVTVLTGHTGEVFTLAWNPKTGSLATGSGDGCARLWRVLGVEGSGGGSNSSSSASSSSGVGGEVCTVLRHTAGEHGRLRKDEPHDVSSMDWSPDGTKLVTGSVDGRGRIWSGGALLHTLSLHAGQIFASQWNPSGSLIATASGELGSSQQFFFYALLSPRSPTHASTPRDTMTLFSFFYSSFFFYPSVDKTTAVWDATTGEPRHSYAFHSAPVLDVDWCSDSMFASGGTDKVIHLCAVGSTAPSRTFLGHTDEVNTLRWSPSKALLASGSDDSTVRLWSAGGEGAPPVGAVATLTGHKKQVYCVRWAPTGEGSANPNKAPILAR